jgi:TrmH family RNA methyltransferase
VRLIEEAIRSRLKLHALFVRESSKTRAQRIIDQLSKHAEALLLPDSVFDSAVLTESPQGLAALVKVRQHDFGSALAVTPALVLVAAAVQDPGNVGTLIRSAEAFRATAVVGTEGTVNFWNPKSVRASAGSVFRLPVLKTQTQDLISQLRAREIRLLALMTPHGESPTPNANSSSPQRPKQLPDADLTGPCALFVGNEGAGLTRDLLGEIDEFVAIPQARVESLNAGVAASIALYEAQRQRSAAR